MIDDFLPIVTVSEANTSEHWSRSRKRHKTQQAILRLWFRSLSKGAIPALPVEVTFTRIASRELDSDNLQIAFKWLRDELSLLLIAPDYNKTALAASGKRYKLKGRQDSDKRIKWLYAQEKGQIKGIRIGLRSLLQDIGDAGIQ